MGTVYAKETTMPKKLNQDVNYSVPTEKRNHTEKGDTFSNVNRRRNILGKNKDGEQSFNLQKVKARVDRVHIDGLIRTKDDIIETQVTDLFKAKDFGDVIVCVYKVKRKLESLGCFRSIGVYIDTSEGPHATPDGVQVTFTVREMTRLIGGINTMVGNNECSATIGAKGPNLFGRGERLQMEYSHGTKSSTNINVTFIKPLVNSWFRPVLTASIFNTNSDFPWSGFNQNEKGLLLDVGFNSEGTGILQHNLQYEAICRKIVCSKKASFSVREESGPNLKSALRHICRIDKRDSTIFPTVGSLVQFSTEVAGLGGNISFVKNEFILQGNWTPHEYCTFQLGLQTGLLRELNNDKRISIADRFFLGGPMNLRGFEMRGCGPREESDSLGGDAYWAAALHLYTPLPFRPGRNGIGDLFRLHGFVNGGNVAKLGNNLYMNRNMDLNMDIFSKNVRASVGGGIVMKLGDVARIELNMVAPLRYMKYDVLRSVQFGIGLQYL